MESLWTVDDVSKHLNVKPGTIRYWVHVRAIRFHKMGKLVRFVPQEVVDDFRQGIIGHVGLVASIMGRR
jgi:excisionase family DNA binding protein